MFLLRVFVAICGDIETSEVEFVFSLSQFPYSIRVLDFLRRAAVPPECRIIIAAAVAAVAAAADCRLFRKMSTSKGDRIFRPVIECYHAASVILAAAAAATHCHVRVIHRFAFWALTTRAFCFVGTLARIAIRDECNRSLSISV